MNLLLAKGVLKDQSSSSKTSTRLKDKSTSRKTSPVEAEEASSGWSSGRP
jgi:hypothetical protein